MLALGGLALAVAAFARTRDFAVRFLVRDGDRLRERLSPRFEALSEIAE